MLCVSHETLANLFVLPQACRTCLYFVVRAFSDSFFQAPSGRLKPSSKSKVTRPVFNLNMQSYVHMCVIEQACACYCQVFLDTLSSYEKK
jgi:hypothetical protein